MSTSLKKTPEIIQHVQRLNKISIKQNLASEHSQIQGTYIIEYDGTDGEESINVTESKPSNYALATDKFICLKADNGMLLIEGELESQNCVRDILKVFSPAGFEMGNVRKGMFDLNSPYDICDGNLQVLFYFKYDSSETSIMNQNNEVVATVIHNTEKATFDISYHLETAAIEKILILTGVLMCTKHGFVYVRLISGARLPDTGFVYVRLISGARLPDTGFVYVRLISGARLPDTGFVYVRLISGARLPDTGFVYVRLISGARLPDTGFVYVRLISGVRLPDTGYVYVRLISGARLPDTGFVYVRLISGARLPDTEFVYVRLISGARLPDTGFVYVRLIIGARLPDTDFYVRLISGARLPDMGFVYVRLICVCQTWDLSTLD
ncbi:unnamed protein product [Mytilus coruscus]|uniref:Uncharacterized protein n=1 Tax=Mytilus coruscus TaxID=42192 RepID=A0A6J8B239_MYTCO|nr:unnamed protein product [Mytilus coruscus]